MGHSSNLDVFPKSAYFPPIKVTFEGEIFPAPNAADAYLTSMFDDYKTPPPVEKRVGHFAFLNLHLAHENFDIKSYKEPK